MKLIITPTVSYFEADNLSLVIKEAKKYLKCHNLFNDEDKIAALDKSIASTNIVVSKVDNDYYHFVVESNRLIIPTGLILYLNNFIKSNSSIEIIKQIPTAAPLDYTLSDSLRDYQQDIVNICISKKRGIVKAATGGGKGVCIGEVVYHLRQLGTIVILIPTKALLYQTKEVLINYFTNSNFRGNEKILPEIALVGDGHKEISEDIIICIPKSIPGLVTKNSKFKSILNSAPTLLIDEIHDLSTPGVWTATMHMTSRIYSLGFSATPNGKTPLKLLNEAITGPLLIDIPESRLIREKHIYAPNILMYESPKITLPTWLLDKRYERWAQSKLYDLGVVNNKVRNKLIVRAALEYLEKDKRPLIIIVERVGTTDEKAVSHASILQNLLINTKKDYLQDIPIIHGKSKDATITINRLKNEEIRVVIAGPKAITAGLDIPAIGGVIIAGAKRKDNDFIQRIGRALRIDEYDTLPTIIDIKDLTYPFSEQARHRMELYKSIYGNNCIDIVN
jgi:superfamily II DNA or RNA helicase